jgi:membrane fusion protein (multidrug efflux system)
MVRGKWVLALAFVLLIGAGAGALTLWWRDRQAAKAPPQAPAAPALAAGTELRLEAKLQAVNFIDMPAPVDGICEDFAVAPGDEVAEGQLLGRIRNDGLAEAEQEAQSEMDRAQARMSAIESGLISTRLEVSRAEAEQARAGAELARVEKSYQRQSLLFREGATPRRTYEAAVKEYEAAKADAEAAAAALNAARERLNLLNQDLETSKKLLAEREQALDTAKEDAQAANLVSPADGVVIHVKAQAGDEVSMTLPDLIRIGIDLTAMEAVIEPNPAVLKRLKPGLPVLIATPESPEEGIPGAIREIKGTLVVAEFNSPSPLLRPGMTVFVRVKLP